MRCGNADPGNLAGVRILRISSLALYWATRFPDHSGWQYGGSPGVAAGMYDGGVKTLMNMDKPTYLKLHPNDNVVVLLRQVQAGECVMIGSQRVVIRTALPMGHKIAVHPIEPGEQIVKYGVSIGTATAPIAIGEHVHVHNVRSNYMPFSGKEKPACDAP